MRPPRSGSAASEAGITGPRPLVKEPHPSGRRVKEPPRYLTRPATTGAAPLLVEVGDGPVGLGLGELLSVLGDELFADGGG